LKKNWKKYGTLLKKENQLKGTVKKLVDFGAFIDLGGIEGLLHISEMGWGKVENLQIC
jgi:ribosomal protein S1